MRLSRIVFISTFLVLLMSLAATWLPVEATGTTNTTTQLDLIKVFRSAPLIYSLLMVMSVLSLSVWLHSLLTFKLSDMLPREFINNIRELLAQRRFEAALAVCQKQPNFCASILACGIAARKHGPQVMMDVMQSEGRRSGNSLWQRISFLSDVAIVAPMLGLLGTVLGLFFAFYDTNRSPESVTSIFDGLGIAVGTTVAGLIVAILSMIFYTSLKFRLVNILNTIETEVLRLVNMVEDEEPNTTTPKESAGNP